MRVQFPPPAPWKYERPPALTPAKIPPLNRPSASFGAGLTFLIRGGQDVDDFVKSTLLHSQLVFLSVAPQRGIIPLSLGFVFEWSLPPGSAGFVNESDSPCANFPHTKNLLQSQGSMSHQAGPRERKLMGRGVGLESAGRSSGMDILTPPDYAAAGAGL